MGRHAKHSNEKLQELVDEIKVNYGAISIETLKKAHAENPEKYPSYKMFERRFGGVKNIKKTTVIA